MNLELPRRVAPQPSPAIVEGGDCGACCLAAVTGLSVREAYELVEREPAGLTWHDMEEALEQAQLDELVADIVTTVPLWLDAHPAHLIWGATGSVQGHGWLDYLRLALTAGFYAITPIDHAARGPYVPGDHWVLIRGLRRRWERIGEGAHKRHVEVLVSSSAGGGTEEWIEAADFLERRGGFAVLLARPAKAAP